MEWAGQALTGDITPQIVALLAKQMPADGTVTPSMNIAQETGLDSVAIMDFVMDVEDMFDISIPLDRTAHVETVADLCTVVEVLLSEAG